MCELSAIPAWQVGCAFDEFAVFGHIEAILISQEIYAMGTNVGSDECVLYAVAEGVNVDILLNLIAHSDFCIDCNFRIG